MLNFVLYIHIFAASIWIGASVLLFGLGFYLKNSSHQSLVYRAIGEFYGFFQLFWLLVLIITGTILIRENNLWSIILNFDSTLSTFLTYKILLVFLIVIVTSIHSSIALKTIEVHKSIVQTIISRTSSLLIFILNFFILYYGIGLRSILLGD